MAGIESTSSLEAIKDYQKKLKFNYIELQSKKNFLTQLESAHENLQEFNEQVIEEMKSQLKEMKASVKQKRNEKSESESLTEEKLKKLSNCNFCILFLFISFFFLTLPNKTLSFFLWRKGNVKTLIN